VTESRIDRVLAAIDAGLQSSPESDQYSDVAPSVGSGCVRCPADETTDGGDLCDGCRAFLLGDTETDPAVAQATGWNEITQAPAGCRCPACTGGVSPVWRDAMTREWVTVDPADAEALIDAWVARASDWLAASGAPVVPRPEPDRVAEVTCLECQPGRPCPRHNSDGLDALLYAYGGATRARARADRRAQTVVYRPATGYTRPGPLIPDMAEGDLITFDGQQYTITRITDGVYGPVVDLAPVGPQGITPPDPPEPDTLARARERELLAGLRRSQRRTNRW
jgi:hypothetical protein